MILGKINKNWFLVGIALLFGGFSAWAINRHLTNKTLEIETRSRQHAVTRIVAAQDIKKGSYLSMNHFALRDFNDPLLGVASIDPSDVELLVGKVLMQDVLEGQLILSTLVTEKPPAPLVSKLDSGMRAVTIPVDQINSMSGLLKPGDRIDLLVSFDHQRKRITSPLLSGIQVIAVGHETHVSDSVQAETQPLFETVTLATTAEQAVMLVSARQSGTITAVLSQHHDQFKGKAVEPHSSGHLAKLLGLEAPPIEVVPVLYGDRSGITDATVPQDHNEYADYSKQAERSN